MGFFSMLTLLIVDNEPQIRRVLTRELGSKFRIVEAGDYHEAIEVLAEHEDVCAVISDYDFGDGPTGQELFERLRVSKPAVPRVMISGSLEAHVHASLVVSGVADLFIKKPWDPGKLGQTVSKLVAERQGVQGSGVPDDAG